MGRLFGITVLALAAHLLLATEASAQVRCRVSDPTDTPLNLRASPNGPVFGRIRNGTLVVRERDVVDDRGRPWTFVSELATGRQLGWVFREFVSCF